MVVVAISGQPGCGSTTTGQLLAKRLGVSFFSLGKWNKEQLKIFEGRRTKSETQDSIEMWKNRKGQSTDFHNNADNMQKQIAAKGNVVIDAKLGIHMLKDIADFSVWLKSGFSVRAARVAGRDKTEKKTAEKMVREKERLERENFVRIYGFDYFDQEKEADIVIDVGDKTPKQIVELILKKMKARKIKP
jgi:predicted cytidylate kinase